MPTPKTQSDFRDPILLNDKELSIHYRANKALSRSNNENTNEQQYVAIVECNYECTKRQRSADKQHNIELISNVSHLCYQSQKHESARK